MVFFNMVNLTSNIAKKTSIISVTAQKYCDSSSMTSDTYSFDDTCTSVSTRLIYPNKTVPFTICLHFNEQLNNFVLNIILKFQSFSSLTTMHHLVIRGEKEHKTWKTLAFIFRLFDE